MVITEQTYIKHYTRTAVTTYNKAYYKVLLINDEVVVVQKTLEERLQSLPHRKVSCYF